MAIGKIGEKLDLNIRQGATFGPVIATMRLVDGTPYDLTGATIRGQLRKSRTAAEKIDLDCIITAPLLGEYTFGLTDEVTATMTAGDSPGDDESKYLWDLELSHPDGTVTALYYGTVKVLRRITQ